MRINKKIIIYILIIVISVSVIFPFYWMINISLQKGTLNQYPPVIFPKEPHFESYKLSLTSTAKPILLWLRNSLIVSLACMFITVLFSLFAGYAIARYRFGAKNTFSFLIISTQMLPAPLLLIPIYIIFQKVNLTDSLFGLIVINVAFSMPLCVWLLRGFFMAVPSELEDAAIVDGCTRMGAFFKVYIPLILPGIAATGIFAFILAWDEFFAANTLINTNENWVASFGLSTFIGEHTTSWSQIMAGAVLFTLPPLILFLFVQKYLIAGLTAGAVKE